MSHMTHAHGPLNASLDQAASRAESDRGGRERRLIIAFALTATFMFAEFIGGLWTGSLALLADAGHMFNDAFALGIAVLAARMASRPADSKRSYGYGRLQVLAAFANGMILLLIAFLIASKAIERLMQPVDIMSLPMLLIALGGLFVNVICLFLLRSISGRNLNIRSAMFHVAGDLVGSLAAIIAAGLILGPGWTAADPILSIVVVGLIVVGAIKILFESGHILLEGTPRGIDTTGVIAALRAQVPSVADIHDVHIWSLDSEEPLITLHAVLQPGSDREAALAALQAHLTTTLGFAHATIQIESGLCKLARRPASQAIRA